MKKIKVGINGFGRIGRAFLKVAWDRPEIEIVAVNDLGSVSNMAYLLKYDSLHGRFDAAVCADDDHMRVNGTEVTVVKEREPARCPWKDLGVDIVIEATGNFRTSEKARPHLQAGAKKVIVTAPMKDETPTFVKGVNDDALHADLDIISNASCTTNCIAPVIKVIDGAFGIERLLVSSVHAYTVSQNLLDNKPREGSDFRRARAATLSIIPTKTGAVKACADIFPHLKGKMDGMAFRVPIPTVSCAYMAFTVREETDADAVNASLRAAAGDASLKGVLAVCDEPLVSMDFMTDPHSSIVDALSTKVVDGRGVQVLSWYDNEWGYAMRVTEMAVKIGAMIGK